MILALTDVESQRLQDAAVALAIGLGVLVVVRVVLGVVLDRLASGLRRRPGVDEQRLRTQLFLVRRLALMVVVAVVAWRVLDIFPSTRVVGQTLLASSAVIAILVGLAVQTPLANLGAGLLLALAQPVRLGDRANVAGATGTVEEITAIHTILLTDDDLRIYIPNTTMITSPIENRTIIDPRRSVIARVPLRLHAPVDEALRLVETVARDGSAPGSAVSALVSEITETAIWLEVEALAPPDTRVAAATSALRTQLLAALGDAGFLPPETAAA